MRGYEHLYAMRHEAKAVIGCNQQKTGRGIRDERRDLIGVAGRRRLSIKELDRILDKIAHRFAVGIEENGGIFVCQYGGVLWRISAQPGEHAA